MISVIHVPRNSMKYFLIISALTTFLSALNVSVRGQSRGWTQSGALQKEYISKQTNHAGSTANMRGMIQTAGTQSVMNNAGINITSDKIMASPLITQFKGDEFKSIMVTSGDGKIYIYNHDGTLRSGFPQLLGLSRTVMSSPAVGDVDGDNKSEIVIAGVSGANPYASDIVIFSPDNNTRFTYRFGYFQDDATTGIFSSINATPCIVNCQTENEYGVGAHPAEEILIRDGMGRISVMRWKGGGQTLLNYTSGDADILNNLQTARLPEDQDRVYRQLISPSVSVYAYSESKYCMVVPSTDGKVYKWILDSDNFESSLKQPPIVLTLPGTEKTLFYASSALADITGDGKIDVIAATMDGRLVVWDGEINQLVNGWPKRLPQSITSTPIAVDLDLDTPGLEIIVGCNDDHVYAFHKNGLPVSGWPVETSGDIFSGVVAGELDGKTGLEVVATCLDGNIYAWHTDGTAMTGWPKRLDTQLYGSAALADLHNSGRMSVVCGGTDGRIFVFELSERSLDTSAGWLQFGGGDHRQGHP